MAAPNEDPAPAGSHPQATDAAHYDAAVQSWDDAYADRNGLGRFDWGAMRAAASDDDPANRR